MNRQISKSLGWLLGAIVIFPLLAYGINHFFIKKFNDNDDAVSMYVQRCFEYRLSMPKSLTLKTTNYATSLLAPKESIYNLTFKEPTLNKFFVIKFFNFPMDKRLAFRSVMRDKIVLLTINKDDLNNPEYGDIKHPIPIFRVREAIPDSNKEIRTSETEWNADITENQFKYNVRQYLTYIMANKEFIDRFSMKNN